ncbi:MAG: carboxypeptidase regulatory-like domain-containing protein [Pyrinomonadaceae bacterium]
MFHKGRILCCALLTAVLLTLPLLVVHSAGGRLEGKILDPNGAAVVGAEIKATDEGTKQTFTARTDQQGRFKIEGLPAGNYTVIVSAKGFSEGRKVSVKVDDGAVVPLDLRLEISRVEAVVAVPTGGLKANTDPVYQQLRQQTDVAGNFATVNNLVLKKEGAEFTLRSGEIYFFTPVEGRVTGAVFIGEGELKVVPPTEIEKNTLKIFVNEPTLTEQFTSLVLRFTDKTFDEVKASANASMASGGAQAARARELFRENQTLLRKRLRDNAELRTLADLYVPEREGFFSAFIGGRRYNKLVYYFDPLGVALVSPEEVLLTSYGESDAGLWTAFHRADEYAKGTASSSEDHRVIDIVRHEIDASIKGTRLTATDVLTIRALAPGTRVIPLSLFGPLRVGRVTDEQGKDLNFIQEAKDEDSDLGVIATQPLEAEKTYKITIQYEGGEALRDSGGGNYILGPRSTWYPNNGGSQFGDRAIFDMTFRYPKNITFVGTGAPVEPATLEGDVAVAKWSSGTTELAVAGFNYGRFKKKEIADKNSGYNIEFYGNQELPDELKQVQKDIEVANGNGVGNQTGTTLGAISTNSMADSAIADAQNATRIYNAWFGKLPYTRIAMTQQPAAGFGQAWPTLVYMPYTAFLDETQRTQLFGVGGGTNSFWRYVGPHELAHQWWGHMIGWDSYHDQWMSEGFAEFSASLYAWYVRKDLNKFVDFWEEKRKDIIEATPQTRNRKPYTVGPVTQGYRLSSAKTGGAYQFLVYPKGAYILHMIRMMMFDRQTGDSRFQAMIKDFVQTHYNKNVSTEDFKQSVEKHITKEMDVDKNGKLDWFFDEWVYGTEMPEYRFEYQVAADGSLSGHITQSNVSPKFVMLVPIYIDLGKGWVKIGSVTLSGNTTYELKSIKLPTPPKKAGICVFNDVLATSIQNVKG